METTLDITWYNLALGYLLLVIPIAVFRHYSTGLIRETLWAALRMTVQLLLVGVYLEYLFRWNSGWVNLAWVLLMIGVAAGTTVKRSGLNMKRFLWPVSLALLVSLGIVNGWFLVVVLRLDFFFESRYFIPITGMLLGNCLKTNVMGLNTYFRGLQKEQLTYRWFLSNGASRSEAVVPFLRTALQDAFNPNIATMAVMGLIALPGMMTGQILGGSSPAVAIKYQIMLMITIFVSSMISVLLTILLANRFAFDGFDRFRLKDVIVGEKGRKRGKKSPSKLPAL
ncbi:MAG TPA: ABC transporter permease [Bacteroidales bacterium]|nr:ABC transporter permease [Bacteroidales bacterium]HRZ77938.1 ABC transporter permease [Bacteroidales bacterium]